MDSNFQAANAAPADGKKAITLKVQIVLNNNEFYK